MKLSKFNHLEQGYPASFSTLLDRFFQDSIGQNVKQFTPAADIAEEEKQYEIHMSVPGMKKSDFELEILDGKLTVSGERKMLEQKDGKNFHTIETMYGSFKRTFFIPDDVQADAIEANYQDGLLVISLPKSEKKVSKSKIEVK